MIIEIGKVRVIGADAGIEHGPANAFSVRAVAEIGWMDLERVRGLAQRQCQARLIIA